MFEPFSRTDQRRWGEVYLRGLLLDGRRKSVEPMAARLGEDGNRQALANFTTTSPWDAAHVRARLAWRMQQVIKPTALIVDDTGFLKDGDASACVARQYTGTAGKVTNCLAGVSLHLASDAASASVDWRLFLPESWDPASPKADPAKAARRTKCGIPEEVGHVEKWQLALDMIDETRSWGIEVPLVVADGGYGDAAAFRLGLEERALDYVVGISTTTTAQPEEARPCIPPYGGRGPRPQPVLPRAGPGREEAGHRGWQAGGEAGAVAGRLPPGQRPQRFEADVLAVRGPADQARRTRDPQESRRTRTTCALAAGRMARHRVRTRAVLAVQPARRHSAGHSLRTAKLRWRIENDYREMKQVLGLAHFEGRTWRGWDHHVTLVSVAHAFCTPQRITRSPKETAPA
ncbi:IS701 family transposase [Streptomyces sp. NPDC085900]|uniref:IS701 family transposase n=1 Tax=Streptomyces sp. NPDC085900 TaxID=3365737 RepID=UPI0037D04285